MVPGYDIVKVRVFNKLVGLYQEGGDLRVRRDGRPHWVMVVLPTHWHLGHGWKLLEREGNLVLAIILSHVTVFHFSICVLIPLLLLRWIRNHLLIFILRSHIYYRKLTILLLLRLTQPDFNGFRGKSERVYSFKFLIVKFHMSF